MRLEQLNYFVEVSRCKSISLAASRLFMSQQNVSTGIKKLEQELGFDLFERTHHGVILTAQGEEVLMRAEEILEKINDLKYIKRPIKEKLSGELLVEMVPYIALPEMIVDFYRHNPATDIKTTEKSPAEIIADVRSGCADVGFIYLRKGETLKVPEIKQEKLSRDQMYFCVSKKLNFPKRSYSPSGVFEKKLPLIVFNSLYDWTMETLEQIEGEKPLVYRADVQLYKKMIMEGLALGFATKTGIDHEVVFSRGEVDTMRITGLQLVVCMLYKKEPTSLLKEGFLEMVRDKFRMMSEDDLRELTQEPF